MAKGVILKTNGEEIEPEEYRIKNEENIEKYAIIFTEILRKIYE